MLSRINRIKELLKEAAVSVEKQESRDRFIDLFPAENANMMFSFSDQYYSAFRSNFGSNGEYLQSINQFEGKPKEEILAAIRNKGEKKDPKDLETYKAKMAYPQLKDPRYDKDLEALRKSEVNPKYYSWVFKILFNEEADPIEEIVKSALFYQRNPEQLELPLESFSLLSELRAYFDKELLGNKEYYYSKIEEHALNPKYTDTIYNSDNFITVLSGTTQSSQYWARGTTWCTSYLEGNMFAGYSSNNVYLYYVITKQDSEFFKKSNPMRKISIGFTKKDGEVHLLTEENATVNADNHSLSLEEIKEYLGPEAASLISSIYSDLNKRDDTKFQKIMNEITPEELNEQIKLMEEGRSSSLLISIIKNEKTRLDTKRAAAKNLAETDPGNFFIYKIHRHDAYKDITRSLSEKIAREFPGTFFIYELDKIDFLKDLTGLAAENLAEKNPNRFFHHNLHKIDAFEDLTILAAKNLAKIDSDMFFRYYLHEYPIHKESAKTAAISLAKYNYLNYFKKELHRNPVYKESTKIAAENYARKDSSLFLRNFDPKLYPHAAKVAARAVVKINPHIFFESDVDLLGRKPLSENTKDFLQKNCQEEIRDAALEALRGPDVGLHLRGPYLALAVKLNIHKIYPKEAKKSALKLIEERPYQFFRNKLYETFPEEAKIAAEKIINNDPYIFGGTKHSPEEVYSYLEQEAKRNYRLASLSKWLVKNGFKEEAKSININIIA